MVEFRDEAGWAYGDAALTVNAFLAQERSYREAGRCGVCGEAGNPDCVENC